MKVKKVQKNQVIIAALAVMIVLAGYLNFRTGGMDVSDSIASNAAVDAESGTETEDVLLELTENDLSEIEVADEEEMEDLESNPSDMPENVGEAVLTSTVVA